MRGIVMAVIAIGAVSAAAVAIPRLSLSDRSPPPAPVAAQHSDVRIRYPADATPTLATADGQRRPVHSVLNVPKRMKFGDFVWNDTGIPAGPAWIRIDLSTQTLSLFRAGHEIGTAVILYGTDHKPTPTGVFPILQRAQQHRSSLYDAEMPFMLRLTNDGVAIHASNVRQGSATHGCIGVPEDFARLMFDQVRRGSIVAIERGKSPPATTT